MFQRTRVHENACYFITSFTSLRYLYLGYIYNVRAAWGASAFLSYKYNNTIQAPAGTMASMSYRPIRMRQQLITLLNIHVWY